jgi:hypothetical protein
MSEPTAPPPQTTAQKKGHGPVAWIRIGCLGLRLLAARGLGACTVLVGKKV